MIAITLKNNIECISIENNFLSVVVVPAMGGKILSVYNKALKKEFLWTNDTATFECHSAGADYDSNFLGAIDELIPNDIPENIDGIDYPDHGELWTTALQYIIKEETVVLYGKLKLSGLFYSKTISLLANKPSVKLDYQIINQSDSARHFLWKLHAALSIKKGDELISSAQSAKVVDPAYSRFKEQTEPFEWPHVAGVNAAIVPARAEEMDFFYLYDTSNGIMQLESKNDAAVFSYNYDTSVFPYEWYFASYGGFLNHYTAILEPCTTMPISVNDAIQQKQTAVLQPNEKIETSVIIYAGVKVKNIGNE